MGIRGSDTGLRLSYSNSTCMRTETGGRRSFTQRVHAEYMEGSDTICPPYIQKTEQHLKQISNVPIGHVVKTF